MGKRRYLTIPNGLSLWHLVFLPLLYVFVLRGMNTACVVGYALLGVTGYPDGLMAKKFNQRSHAGQALDSIADLPFYISTACFMARLFPQYLQPSRMILFVFFGVLASSLVISGIRSIIIFLTHPEVDQASLSMFHVIEIRKK